MKLDLLTNATVVDDAIRFVSEHREKKVKVISSVATVVKEEDEPTTITKFFECFSELS